jgi:hypothetical protein
MERRDVRLLISVDFHYTKLAAALSPNYQIGRVIAVYAVAGRQEDVSPPKGKTCAEEPSWCRSGAKQHGDAADLYVKSDRYCAAAHA